MPGSVEAASFDWNPHKLTEESGAPNPHLSLSVSGAINNVTSDKNSEKGAEESGAPNPHSRRPLHDETDMRPVSQPGKRPRDEGSSKDTLSEPDATSGKTLPAGEELTTLTFRELMQWKKEGILDETEFKRLKVAWMEKAKV